MSENLMISRENWNTFLTGRASGWSGEAAAEEELTSIYSFYCYPQQFAEIEADTGEPLSEEHKTACVRLDEITERINAQNTGDSIAVAIAPTDHEALIELSRNAETQEPGLLVAHLLEPVESD